MPMSPVTITQKELEFKTRKYMLGALKNLKKNS